MFELFWYYFILKQLVATVIFVIVVLFIQLSPIINVAKKFMEELLGG